jgi:hypothetical protein
MAEGGPCRCGRGTLYDVLQVSPWCEQEVIQAAYRALARTRHPDVNRDRDADEQMRRLNGAYKTLSDSVQRARYDEELALESARVVSFRAGTPPPADVPYFAAAAPAAPDSGFHGQTARGPRRDVNAQAASLSYQAMIFEQRTEGMFSRSALYLLVILVTVLLALMVYIIIDIVAAERPMSPRGGAGPRSLQEQPWAPPGYQFGSSSASWLLQGADAEVRPGLSQPSDRWNR